MSGPLTHEPSLGRSQERASFHGSMAKCPIEIVEAIIDLCCGDTQTLMACALTCRSWLPRSIFNLHRRVTLRNYGDLDHLATLLFLHPVLWYGIEEVQVHYCFDYERLLPSFLTSCAWKLKKWRHLELVDTWDGHPLCVHPFAELFDFASSLATVTRLSLVGVTLDALPDLAHLVSFLPELSELKCVDIVWTDMPDTRDISLPRHQPTKLASLHLNMESGHLVRFVEWLLMSGLELNLNEITLQGVKLQGGMGCVDALLKRVGTNIRHLHIVLGRPPPLAKAAVEFVIKTCTRSSANKTLVRQRLREADSIQELVRRGGLSHAIVLESFQICFATPFEEYKDGTVSESISPHGLNRLIYAYAVLCQLSSPTLRRITVDLGLCHYNSNTDALAADSLLSSIDGLLAEVQFGSLCSFTLKSGLRIRPFLYGSINVRKFPLVQKKGVNVVTMDVKQPSCVLDKQIAFRSAVEDHL